MRAGSGTVLFCHGRGFVFQSLRSSKCIGAIVRTMPPKRLRQVSMLDYSLASKEEPQAQRPRKALRLIWNATLAPGLMRCASPDWKASVSDKSMTGKSGKRRVLAFDLDGTLIRTLSGAKFPRAFDDWTPWSKKVIPILRAEHDKGALLVVFTNQGGISSKKIDDVFLQERLESIVKFVGVPLAVYIATQKDTHRKPATGMWGAFLTDVGGESALDLSQSIFVGDAAGRPKDGSRAKDFSDSDRKFALNVGIKFLTPEGFFEKKPCKLEHIGLSGYDPRSAVVDTNSAFVGKEAYSSALPRIVQPRALAVKLESRSDSKEQPQCMIVMCGMPASGKTTFAMRYLKPRGFVWINQDTLGTPSKTIKALSAALASGKSSVVDMTNSSVKSRALYLKLAREHGSKSIETICLRMTTERDVCNHLNVLRDLATSEANTDAPHRPRVPAVAYGVFDKKYEAPNEEEGFDAVGDVTFIPYFETKVEASAFLQYT